MPAPHLSADQIRQTGRFIASLQGDDGALPWFSGGQWDAWNHTEALMGLTMAGSVSRETSLFDAAIAGLDHLRATQRSDGSWPMLVRAGVIEHHESDTNQCAYPAVGVWHLAMTRGRLSASAASPLPHDDGEVDALLQRYWPMVQRAITHVLTARRDDGSIAWAINERGDLGDHALLTGNASILQSLWAATAIAEHLGHGDEVQRWRDAGRQLARTVRTQPGAFVDRRRFSMDWFYPVLGGAILGDGARRHLANGWDRFVWPSQGVRCVDDRPWVTGGESAELVMALLCLDGTAHEPWARTQASAIFTAMQHTRTDGGGYWTGYVVDDDAIWPEEQTGWTAGAMLLAADALDTLTPAANFFHAMTW